MASVEMLFENVDWWWMPTDARQMPGYANQWAFGSGELQTKPEQCLDHRNVILGNAINIKHTVIILSMHTEKSAKNSVNAGAVWSESTRFAILSASFGHITVWSNYTVKIFGYFQHFLVSIKSDLDHIPFKILRSLQYSIKMKCENFSVEFLIAP